MDPLKFEIIGKNRKNSLKLGVNEKWEDLILVGEINSLVLTLFMKNVLQLNALFNL